jgi:hypothetical protein
MRFKISSAKIIIAIFIIAAATAPSILADAPAKDACLFLTQAQVSDAVGGAFGAGTHVNAQFLKTCTWTPAGSVKDVKAVTLNIQTADSYDSGKKQIEMAKSAGVGEGVTLTSAGGIGDDAYYIPVGTNIMQLFFKKGTLAFKIAIYGALPSDKAMAAEKTLALEVITKL